MKMNPHVIQFLKDKGIAYWEANGQLVSKCIFQDCDKDSREGEGHLYIDPATGLHICHKCGSKGNLVTLAKLFGDISNKDTNWDQSETKSNSKKRIGNCAVEKAHEELPNRIREWLKERGITDEVIDAHKIGYIKVYGRNWISIPIMNIGEDDYSYFKLREDPISGNHKRTFPTGWKAQLFNWQILNKLDQRLIICEGELDALALESRGIPAICGTHGAGTFKKEWADVIPKELDIHFCYDNDDAGRKGRLKGANILMEKEFDSVHYVDLPKEVGEKGDVTDFLVKLGGDPNDLFLKYAMPFKEKIDTSKFSPLTIEGLASILSTTIKQDFMNKVIAFLCMLSAYTDGIQQNVSFNSPSSTGKTYIPSEVAEYFPEEDIIKIGHCCYSAPKSGH